MTRSGVVLGCLALAACDHFSVQDFHGSRLVLTLHGVSPTPAGQHVELWARDGDDDVVRLLWNEPPDLSIGKTGYGTNSQAYTIAQTVDIDDPCMIDAAGNLLWSPDAQTGTDDQKKLEAMSVEQRIHQLTDEQPVPLLALVTYDDAAGADRPQSKNAMAPNYVDPKAPAADRLRACNAFWSKSQYAYDGNPIQLTAPVNGQLFGMVDFTAMAPAPQQVIGGIDIESQFALHDLREIWFTQTTATVEKLDPGELDCARHPDTCRGQVILQGNAGTPANGIYHFELGSPLAGVSGSAAVYTRLDEDHVQF